jgi:hypothetical protein
MPIESLSTPSNRSVCSLQVDYFMKRRTLQKARHLQIEAFHADSRYQRQDAMYAQDAGVIAAKQAAAAGSGQPASR